MHNQYVFQTASDSLLLPKIIQINDNLYVAAFPIMKLLPAKNMITEAIKRGDIKEKSIVLDTSSGNFALGMGMVCAELGLRFKIFGDPAIDPTLAQRLEELGGGVHICTNSKNPGAYQKQRLEALNNFISLNKLSYWIKQYDNPDNAKAYKIVGKMILDALGSNINIVGPVGSGGSTSGIIAVVREKNPSSKLIGVDTFNSVLFGLPDGKRILRGLGNSIMPKNLNHTAYDQVHWISANDAFYYTRWLFQKKAIFCGPTTGAAYQVASYLANKNKDQKYLFISPDDGYRYLNTVYDTAWLKQQSFYNTEITKEAIMADAPAKVVAPWSFMNWNRCSYKQVLGKDFCE